MPDEMTLRPGQDAERSFTPTPAGPQQAVCVDLVDLGWTTDQYKDQPVRVIHKIALVFQTDIENEATGKRFEPSIEFTVGQELTDDGLVRQVTTFGERSKIRQFLAHWRNKAYTAEEMRGDLQIHKVVGVNAMLGIEHKTSKNDRVYANIATVQSVHPKLPKIVAHKYERSEHWQRKKDDYALKLAEYRKVTAPSPAQSYEAMPAALEPVDDDLPF